MNSINADFGQFVHLATNDMPWAPSPSATVWRKRLDLTGASESSRVTSIVRYDAASAFPSHPHPNGEEILVLDGVFSDQHGDYPAGSFLLNPEGFDHAPKSKEGCVLFVKLRQYPGLDRATVRIDTNTAPWENTADGIERLPLFEDKNFSERIWLSRMAAGARGREHGHPGGAEMYVLLGSLSDEYGTYAAGDWVRRPVGSRHQLHSDGGATYYVKVGHLAGL